MPKRVIIIDMIANFIVKKFLPAGIPEFHKIDDLSLLIYRQLGSEMVYWKSTYNTAFEQVFPEKQLKDSRARFWWMVYVIWSIRNFLLVVREELIRAFRIHMASGRMDVLRLGAVVERYAKRMMYVGLFFLFLILVF